MSWDNDQRWERDWHGTCQNTYGEEVKQFLYANRMGLKTFHDGKSPFNFDMHGQSVLDIGGGPCSLLLKCHNVRGKVIDPCQYPDWVYARYELAGIEVERVPAEQAEQTITFDMCLIYNVLQHTQDPEKIVRNARRWSRVVHLFEWIDTGTSQGHPHNLTEAKLNEWLGGVGKVEELKGDHTCWGKCFYGVFQGDHWKE